MRRQSDFKLIILILITLTCGSISFYFLKILPDQRRLEDSISYQDKCSAQSRIAYKDLTSLDPSSNSTPNGISYNFESHYNSKLNRCFILLYTHSFDPNLGAIDDENLYDSYGLNTIASFTEIKNSLKAVDNVETCIVNEKECSLRTSDEFTMLIKPYMTN